MQTTRISNYRKKKAARTAYKVWVENGRVDFKPIPTESKQAYYDRPNKAERTEAQLAADAAHSESFAQKAELIADHQAQLALAPDFRPGVAAMRARMAERFGPLMPLGRRGWTA